MKVLTVTSKVASYDQGQLGHKPNCYYSHKVSQKGNKAFYSKNGSGPLQQMEFYNAEYIGKF
jgi:hypothetical protein